MKTLILGLGNPILSDDAVGIIVARELGKQFPAEQVEVKEASIGGLGLLDLIEGYEKVIIVDSIKTEGGRIGSLYHLTPEDFSLTVRLSSPHHISFATTLEIGKQLNLNLPKEIKIYAIEVADNQSFSTKLTPWVEKALPGIIQEIVGNI